MNFLAHLQLSGDQPSIMVGNFIGDFVKGKNLYERFEPGIARGIALHRSIDEFTDQHPVVRVSKNRLRPKYRHYAGVIVDVFYDHFLAANWPVYHHEPLAVFAARAYETILHFDPILPEPVRHLLPYMIDGNWLVSYGTVGGIHKALSGMARRTRFDSGMERATQDLTEHADLFGDEFRAFFPDLVAHCRQFITTHQDA